MIPYRELAENIQRRTGLSFEATLTTISVAFKAMAHQMTQSDVSILRRHVPPELRQLLGKSRGSPGIEMSSAIELVRVSLDISSNEAKRRILGLLDELKAGVPLWPLERSDSSFEFLELLDRLRAQCDAFDAAPAAAVA